MKDYQKELLEQRHKNAEKDKETEKLRVNMFAFEFRAGTMSSRLHVSVDQYMYQTLPSQC